MSQELPTELAPLAVMKVLYRNTDRIAEHGGRRTEVLHAVQAFPTSSALTSESLREAVRAKDVKKAESIFAGIARTGADEDSTRFLLTVQDNTEVHRVVLPYRAWDMLQLAGKEQAQVLLRQSCDTA